MMIPKTIDLVKKAKVLAFGDSIVDMDIDLISNPRNLNRKNERFCIKRTTKTLGGGANVIENLQRLRNLPEDEIVFFTLVSEDDNGNWMIDRFTNLHLNVVDVPVEGNTVKKRFRRDGEIVLHLDEDVHDKTFFWDDRDRQEKRKEIAEAVNEFKGKVSMLIDYGKGFFNDLGILNDLKNLKSEFVLIEPDSDKYLNTYCGIKSKTVLKVSHEQLRHFKIQEHHIMNGDLAYLPYPLDYSFIWITLGVNGSVLLKKNDVGTKIRYACVNRYYLPNELQRFDAQGIGHGDLALAGMAWWLLQHNSDIDKAAEFGTLLSAYCANRPGTIKATSGDVEDALEFMRTY